MKPPRVEPAAVLASTVAGLGTLETKVMGAVWSARGELSVRDLQASLGVEHAYTTLMTTMDRLFKKGLLTRRKEGRAFRYAARVSRRDLSLGAVAAAIRRLLGCGAEPVLSGLIDAVTERDRQLLDTLDRLVQEKRQKLGKEESR